MADPYFYLTSSASCGKDNFCDYLIYQQKPDGSYGFVDKATYPRLANYKSQHLTAQYAPFSYDINLNNQLDKMKILSIQVSGSGILVPEQTKVDLTGVNCKMINGAEGQGFLPVMKGGSWDIAISKSCEKGVLTISDIETGQILDQ
ncbi:hypothetical protein I3271_07375 [Photobacterium leiognathi]|uniref:hypothetical protein n=1 Tax=Photobacterium leiognathi TaxID=553611 RepID=UPI001EDDB010|nr:hypothetical protein [Photobacterium leiognathi]MCG3884506.1 hypothetical protein [Photobacterium leiognathi]